MHFDAAVRRHRVVRGVAAEPRRGGFGLCLEKLLGHHSAGCRRFESQGLSGPDPIEVSETVETREFGGRKVVAACDLREGVPALYFVEPSRRSGAHIGVEVADVLGSWAKGNVSRWPMRM